MAEYSRWYHFGTSDLVALYPSIPREAGLKALKDALDNGEKSL